MVAMQPQFLPIVITCLRGARSSRGLPARIGSQHVLEPWTLQSVGDKCPKLNKLYKVVFFISFFILALVAHFCIYFSFKKKLKVNKFLRSAGDPASSSSAPPYLPTSSYATANVGVLWRYCCNNDTEMKHRSKVGMIA